MTARLREYFSRSENVGLKKCREFRVVFIWLSQNFLLRLTVFRITRSDVSHR